MTRVSTKSQSINGSIDLSSRFSGQAGFSLIEILAVAGILSVVMLGLSLSSAAASKSVRKSIEFNSANQLAYSSLEELTARDPALLSDSDDEIELGLNVNGIQFSRQVDITVNADGSRTVEVVVTPQAATSTTEVSVQHTFAMWGTL